VATKKGTRNFFSPLSFVEVFGSGIRDKHPGSAILCSRLKCEIIFDNRIMRVNQILKVVLLHLWHVKVKTTRGFSNNSLDDFHIDKTAP
jgi:hypothetical protein